MRRPVQALCIAITNSLALLSLLLMLAAASAPIVQAQSPNFWRAIEANDIDSLRTELLRGANPNARHPEHGPAIVAAARFKSFDAVRVLASLNATDVDAASSADENALMLVSMLGDRRSFDALLQRGAQVNRPGWTPLHYAASGGQLELVKVLIDQHAFIDAQSPNGTTPLMMAARMRALPVVQYLIDQGADPSLRNQAGLDATAYLERNGERQWAIWMRERVQRYVARYGTVEQPRWTATEAADAAQPASTAGRPADLGAVQMNREVNVAPDAATPAARTAPPLPPVSAPAAVAGQGASGAPPGARAAPLAAPGAGPAPASATAGTKPVAPSPSAQPAKPAAPPPVATTSPPPASRPATPPPPAPPPSATPAAPVKPAAVAAPAAPSVKPVTPIAPAASAPVAPMAPPASPPPATSPASSTAAAPKPPSNDSEPLFFSRTLTIPSDPPAAPPAAGKR